VDCKTGKLRIGLAIRPLWTAILTKTTVLGAVIYAMSIPSGAFLFSCAYFGRRFKCYLYLMRYRLINTSTRTRPEQYCTGEPARTTNKCPRMIAVRNHSIRTVRKLAANVTRTIQDDVDDGSTPMCARLDPALVQQTLRSTGVLYGRIFEYSIQSNSQSLFPCQLLDFKIHVRSFM
jgi:hypothetical protein